MSGVYDLSAREARGSGFRDRAPCRVPARGSLVCFRRKQIFSPRSFLGRLPGIWTSRFPGAGPRCRADGRCYRHSFRTAAPMGRWPGQQAMIMGPTVVVYGISRFLFFNKTVGCPLVMIPPFSFRRFLFSVRMGQPFQPKTCALY